MTPLLIILYNIDCIILVCCCFVLYETINYTDFTALTGIYAYIKFSINIVLRYILKYIIIIT